MTRMSQDQSPGDVSIPPSPESAYPVLERRSHASAGVLIAIVLSLASSAMMLVDDLWCGEGVASGLLDSAVGLGWAVLITVPIGALIGWFFSRDAARLQPKARRRVLFVLAFAVVSLSMTVLFIRNHLRENQVVSEAEAFVAEYLRDLPRRVGDNRDLKLPTSDFVSTYGTFTHFTGEGYYRQRTMITTPRLEMKRTAHGTRGAAPITIYVGGTRDKAAHVGGFKWQLDEKSGRMGYSIWIDHPLFRDR